MKKAICKTSVVENIEVEILHGKYPAALLNSEVSKALAFNWITKRNLYAKTDGFLFTVQDSVIKVENYENYISEDDIVHIPELEKYPTCFL